MTKSKAEEIFTIPSAQGCICNSLTAILLEREQELLELKGPCSNKKCPLHYAHRGPCAPEGYGSR